MINQLTSNPRYYTCFNEYFVNWKLLDHFKILVCLQWTAHNTNKVHLYVVLYLSYQPFIPTYSPRSTAPIASGSVPVNECTYKKSKVKSSNQKRTDGSVVEFSPATREARVRFPVSALTFFFFFFPLHKFHISTLQKTKRYGVVFNCSKKWNIPFCFLNMWVFISCK